MYEHPFINIINNVDENLRKNHKYLECSKPFVDEVIREAIEHSLQHYILPMCLVVHYIP